MKYKKYGSTGKTVSALGFGGMRFIKENGKYNIDKCAEIVKAANDFGVNYFDTAPMYAEGQGELIFGNAFKHMRNEFFVSTKSLAKTGDELRRDLDNSLRNLNVPKINFFHIWCVLSLEDYKVRIAKGGPYEAAFKAKQEGLIEHLAISTHSNSNEIETIVSDGLFEGITLGFNIINFKYRYKGLEAAYNAGMGVATMNPLDGGVIPDNADYFSFIKSGLNVSVVESAINFNISHNEISTVLVGIGTMEQLKENIMYSNNCRKIDENELKAIESKISPELQGLCTGCRYCEKSCPCGIQVPKVMMSYNQKIFKGTKRGLENLWLDWNIRPENVQVCKKCGKCEESCTQRLPIMERLSEISRWCEV